MILWDTILNRLSKKVNSDELRFIDIRYLDKWFEEYPELFPKYMLKNQYNLNWNYHKNSFRWEITKK